MKVVTISLSATLKSCHIQPYSFIFILYFSLSLIPTKTLHDLDIQVFYFMLTCPMVLLVHDTDQSLI